MSEAKRNLLSKNAIKYFRANFEKEMLMKQLIEIFN
jgi:hypothetical protein